MDFFCGSDYVFILVGLFVCATEVRLFDVVCCSKENNNSHVLSEYIYIIWMCDTAKFEFIEAQTCVIMNYERVP